MSSHRMIIYFVRSCLMLSLLQTSEAVYSFQCPTQSHWRHREGAYCNSSFSYFCLYDRNKDHFTEICRKKSDFETLGYKQIVSGSKQGTLQGEPCEKDLYQPFKFNTSGNSRCVYQKYPCSEEGQVIYSDGTNEANSECRCDHTRGYDFLQRPKNQCFCVPSEEDCSCYLKICSFDGILSPDYECLRKKEWKTKFNCVPRNKIDVTEESSTIISTEGHIKQAGDVKLPSLIATLLMVFCIAVICVFLFGTKVLQNKKDDFNENENTTSFHQYIPDFKVNEIIKLRKRNEQFEVTKASKKVLNQVKTHGFVILSGPPGSGKSAIGYYTAFMLERHDAFVVMPVSSPDEIRKYLLPHKKQVFVIDDPVGKYTVDDASIQLWKNEETFIKQTFPDCSNRKLILTCRSYIYKSWFSRKLQVSPFHCDMLSDNLKLSVDEKTNIRHRYNIPELNNVTLTMYDCLPLLCATYSEHDDTALFFVNPIKVLSEEMNKTKEKSDIAFLAIALLVVRNNYIVRQTLSLENPTIKELLNDLCDECGFQYFPSTSCLLSSLCNLIGTYIHKTEDGFSCIHDTLFKNLSFIVGSSIIHCIIKYGSSKFLANRMQLTSIQEEHDELVIMVEREQEDLYFQRLLRDIRKGYHSHVFTGIQMKYSQFRSKLLTCLEHSTTDDLTYDENSSTPLHVVSEQGYDDLVFKLFQLKKDQINHQDKNKNTPLFLACLGGHDKVIQTLLVIDNSSLHVANNEDLTPLDVASINDHFSTVKLLLHDGAKVNRKDKNLKRTALQRACECGSTNVVSLLLTQKPDVKNIDTNGLKAIHIACQKGHLDIVELLLKYKDMLNEYDAHARTPIFIACESNQQNIVDMLLKKKANVNQTDVQQISPLYKACQIGNENIVGLLLDNSAKLNVKSDNGYSPLHVACMNGKLKCVEILLNKHPEIDLATNQGWTPFLISCSEGHLEICILLHIWGANINAGDKSATTPLHIACREKHERIVRFLIEHDANVNAVNRQNESPLYIACVKECFDIVQLLLNFHADVQICDEKGNSPLHVVCSKGNTQIVQLLIDKKAEIHKPNKTGETPFDVVHGKKNDIIVDMLNHYKENVEG